MRKSLGNTAVEDDDRKFAKETGDRLRTLLQQNSQPLDSEDLVAPQIPSG